MDALVGTFSTGMAMLFQPLNFVTMIVGVLWGIVFGAVPGLTATMGVALAIPITYALRPETALILLSSIFVGAISGGFISAGLINMPGTPSSIASTFDAYPMSKRGETAKALAISLMSSFYGGIIAVFLMIIATYSLVQIALKFGPFEYFALGILAFAGCIGMMEGGIVKNAIGFIIGILLATIGADTLTGTGRLTFRIPDLIAGIDILPLLVGMFGVSEVLVAIEEKTQNVVPLEARNTKMGFKVIFDASKTILWDQPINFLRSLAIGFILGVFPAVGGATSCVVSYGFAKSFSKHPEKFGTGIPDGIIASEAANNATVPGTLVPLLALGIPGDATTAMMIGGFMIHGLFPGPLLFRDNPEYVYTIFASQFFGIIVMVLLGILLMRFFIHVLSIKSYYLFPLIMICMVIGSYGLYNRMLDVWLMLISGVMGYVFKKINIPLVPIITAFVLGPIIEKGLRQGVAYSGGSLMPLFTRPICQVLLVSAVFLFILGMYVNVKVMSKIKVPKPDETEN
jgi:putative tricarboxylic transport membrane protein